MALTLAEQAAVEAMYQEWPFLRGLDLPDTVLRDWVARGLKGDALFTAAQQTPQYRTSLGLSGPTTTQAPSVPGETPQEHARRIEQQGRGVTWVDKVTSRFKGDPNGGGYHQLAGGGYVADTWQGVANAQAAGLNVSIPKELLTDKAVREAYPEGDIRRPTVQPDGSVKRGLFGPEDTGSYVVTPAGMGGGDFATQRTVDGFYTGQPGSTSVSGYPSGSRNYQNYGTFHPTGGTAEQQDAFAFIQQTLNEYGLGSLAQWAWGELTHNRSQSQILLEMQEQPAFKQRFPALDMLRQKGLPVISPAEYIAYETSARQMFAAAGFPPGFYDQPSDFTQYIGNGKSLAELSQQVSLYQRAAFDAPQELRDQLKNLYGIDEGGIAAVFATPDEKLPQLIQHFESAAIAGQAQRQRFGQLSQSEAERLRALGVTEQSAAQGFSAVDQAKELFQRLPGEAENAPGRNEALGVVSGDTAALSAVDRQARLRKAAFSGGGNYATGQQGVSGLGSAATT